MSVPLIYITARYAIPRVHANPFVFNCVAVRGCHGVLVLDAPSHPLVFGWENVDVDAHPPPSDVAGAWWGGIAR